MSMPVYIDRAPDVLVYRTVTYGSSVGVSSIRPYSRGLSRHLQVVACLSETHGPKVAFRKSMRGTRKGRFEVCLFMQTVQESVDSGVEVIKKHDMFVTLLFRPWGVVGLSLSLIKYAQYIWSTFDCLSWLGSRGLHFTQPLSTTALSGCNCCRLLESAVFLHAMMP